MKLDLSGVPALSTGLSATDGAGKSAQLHVDRVEASVNMSSEPVFRREPGLLGDATSLRETVPYGDPIAPVSTDALPPAYFKRGPLLHWHVLNFLACVAASLLLWIVLWWGVVALIQ